MKTKHWFDKIFSLIEKEIELFDKRHKKLRKIHPSDKCYMNNILQECERLMKRAIIDSKKVVFKKNGYFTVK